MDWESLLYTNWHVKLVAVILIVAAWIDGKELRVPNWLTYSMVLAGLVYNSVTGVIELTDSTGGTILPGK